MEDKSVTLKACPNPWCTAHNRPIPVALKHEGWRVLCECGVSTYRYPTEAEAIAAWNHRSEAQATGLREAVEAVVEEAKRMTMTMRRRKIFNDLAAVLEGTERHG